MQPRSQPTLYRDRYKLFGLSVDAAWIVAVPFISSCVSPSIRQQFLTMAIVEVEDISDSSPAKSHGTALDTDDPE